MNGKKPAHASILLRGLDRDERADFKAWCDKKGSTMSNELRRFIRRVTGRGGAKDKGVIA